jgi:hypothetical protein
MHQVIGSALQKSKKEVENRKQNDYNITNT